MPYQGYKNYETWAVSLWLLNDEGLYRMVREWVAELAEEAGSKKEHLRLVAHHVKDWIEENNPLADDPSCYSDILTAAIGEVDWVDVAEDFIEDEDDEEDAGDENDEEVDDD